MLGEIHLSTGKKNELVDITGQIKEQVRESKVKDGVCYIYCPHVTAAVIINENYDPNICLDFIDALNNAIPKGKWRHDKIDNNGAAHIKAAIIGPSEMIPIKNKGLMLGRWQNAMLVELDGPRKRTVIIKIIKG